MAQVHGSKAKLWIDDQAGTCRDVSGDYNTITLTRSKNLPDNTTFGKGDVQRADGLRDVSLDLSAIFNSSGCGTEVAGLMDNIWGGSLVTRVQFLPSGSVSGSPIYTASMRVQNLVHQQPVDGLVTLQATMQLASGSLVSACIA